MGKRQWKAGHKMALKKSKGATKEDFLLGSQHPSVQISKPNRRGRLVVTDCTDRLSQFLERGQRQVD